MLSGLRSGSGDIGPWKLNEWRTHDEPIVMCESGFHASVRAIDAMRFLNCEVLALVEVKGKHRDQDDKQVWESMRVVKAYEWTKPDSVAMAIYCAELVIGIYEKKKNPNNKRPRQAIVAARAWLETPTEKNRLAAAAAYAAAYDKADYAAAAAAYAAASAAYDAAYDSAYDAAYAYAEEAKKGTLEKVEKWIMARVTTLKEVKI